MLWLVSMVLLPTGCGDRLPTGSSDGRFIMPLAVGNQWIGVETTYAPDGSVTGTRLDTIEIVDLATNTTTDETWYKSNQVENDQVVWYRNSEGGLHRMPTEVGMIPDCNCLQLHYPAAQGDTFLLPLAQVLIPDPNGGPPQTVTQKIGMYLESTETTVQVPNGEHKCYVYWQRIFTPKDARFSNDLPWHYYVPDLGPIKMEWYPSGDPAKGPIVKKWELKDVVLK